MSAGRALAVLALASGIGTAPARAEVWLFTYGLLCNDPKAWPRWSMRRSCGCASSKRFSPANA